MHNTAPRPTTLAYHTPVPHTAPRPTTLQRRGRLGAAPRIRRAFVGVSNHRLTFVRLSLPDFRQPSLHRRCRLETQHLRCCYWGLEFQTRPKPRKSQRLPRENVDLPPRGAQNLKAGTSSRATHPAGAGFLVFQGGLKSPKMRPERENVEKK